MLKNYANQAPERKRRIKIKVAAIDIVHRKNLAHQEKNLKKFDLELKLEKLEEKLDEMEDKFPAIGNFELELEKKAKKLKFGKIKSHTDN